MSNIPLSELPVEAPFTDGAIGSSLEDYTGKSVESFTITTLDGEMIITDVEYSKS